MKNHTLVLTAAEYEHLKVTLEGCATEFTQLSAQISWYATSLVERIETCVEILDRAK